MTTGAWFGVKLEGPFKAGSSVRGKLTIPKYEHMELELKIEAMKPEDYFSYRWHPYAIDPATDYSKEPMTLVEFRLEETKEGTIPPSSSRASTRFRQPGAPRRSE